MKRILTIYFLLASFLLSGCIQTPPKKELVTVQFKAREVQLPLCTQTGSMQFYKKQQEIPEFYWDNADIIQRRDDGTVLMFRLSKCDFTQHHYETRKEKATMELSQFQFRYDHDLEFRKSIENYYFHE